MVGAELGRAFEKLFNPPRVVVVVFSGLVAVHLADEDVKLLLVHVGGLEPQLAQGVFDQL